MQDFDEIYSKYFSEVYKFVLSLCQNSALAEKITQEAFFKALKNIDGFKGNCKLSTWLCEMAKNTFYSYSRKHNSQTDYPFEIIISDENIEEQFADRCIGLCPNPRSNALRFSKESGLCTGKKKE